MLLHGDDKKPNNQKESHTKGETGNKADAVLTANSCSGSLQTFPITLSSENISIETKTICDTGSTLSFVDKSLRDQLDVPEKSITLNIAGNNGDGQRQSENQGSNSECVVGVRDVHVHPSMYLGNKSHDYNDLKQKYSHLDVLPGDNMDLKQVKVVLVQDNYHLLFPVAYRKGKRKEPWAVKTKLG